MSPFWLLLIVPVSIAIGVGLGFFISQKITKKMLRENPPINEAMIRAMYSQIGRKPSEAQIRQTLSNVNRHLKQ